MMMLQLISYFLVEKSINVGVFTLNIFKVNTLGSRIKRLPGSGYANNMKLKLYIKLTKKVRVIIKLPT